MKQLIAFHGQQAIKDKYLSRIATHRELDQLVKGATGEGGKGCAIWCTLDGYNHAAYESELGIPAALARLEDSLFEGLTLDLAMEWPQRFLRSIEPGADLSLVMARFFVWLLTDPTDGVIKFAKSSQSREATQKVSDLYARKIAGERVAREKFKISAAADAAAYAYVYATAYAAAYAAAAAADAANAAAAAYARTTTLAKCAVLVRKRLKVQDIR